MSFVKETEKETNEQCIIFHPDAKYLKLFYMMNNIEIFPKMVNIMCIFFCLFFVNTIFSLVKFFLMHRYIELIYIFYPPFLGSLENPLIIYIHLSILFVCSLLFIATYNKLVLNAECRIFQLDLNNNLFRINICDKYIDCDINDKTKRIEYEHIKKCYRIGKRVFVKSHDNEYIIVPCVNKSQSNLILKTIKTKVKETLIIQDENTNENVWIEKMYDLTHYKILSKIIRVTIWISFFYYYIEALVYEKFDFIGALRVRWYMPYNDKLCYRMYELLIIFIIATILLYILKLIIKKKIEGEYSNE